MPKTDLVARPKFVRSPSTSTQHDYRPNIDGDQVAEEFKQACQYVCYMVDWAAFIPFIFRYARIGTGVEWKDSEGAIINAVRLLEAGSKMREEALDPVGAELVKASGRPFSIKGVHGMCAHWAAMEYCAAVRSKYDNLVSHAANIWPDHPLGFLPPDAIKGHWKRAKEYYLSEVPHHFDDLPEGDDLKLLKDAVGCETVMAGMVTLKKTEGVEHVQYVTLNQMAAWVGKSKKTLEKRKNAVKSTMPPPDVESVGGGTSNEWDWARVRPWLEKEFGKKLLERIPDQLLAKRS